MNTHFANFLLVRKTEHKFLFSGSTQTFTLPNQNLVPEKRDSNPGICSKVLQYIWFTAKQHFLCFSQFFLLSTIS